MWWHVHGRGSIVVPVFHSDVLVLLFRSVRPAMKLFLSMMMMIHVGGMWSYAHFRGRPTDTTSGRRRREGFVVDHSIFQDLLIGPAVLEELHGSQTTL